MDSIKYLFVIGRPGSGKSTVSGIIQNLFQTQKMNSRILNDWEILNQFAIQETFPSLIQANDKGFKVLDDEIYDIALEKLITNLQSENRFDINIVEFSRKSYLASFMYISKIINKKNIKILFISADLEKCILRNKKRESHEVPL